MSSNGRRFDTWAAAEVSPNRAQIARPGPLGRRTKCSRHPPPATAVRQHARPPPVASSLARTLRRACSAKRSRSPPTRTNGTRHRHPGRPRGHTAPHCQGAGRLVPTRVEGHPGAQRHQNAEICMAMRACCLPRRTGRAGRGPAGPATWRQGPARDQRSCTAG